MNEAMVAGKAKNKTAKKGLKKVPPKRSTSKVGARRIVTADFMADLVRQEASQREKDIAARLLIPGSELRERLGVSAQALSGAIRARRMFALRGPSGVAYYPAFFADDKYERPMLEQVCNALRDLPGGSKWNFFMTPKISLEGRTPLQALKKGQLDAVLVTAMGFLEE